jgi:DNA-directed RNA polymerase omega subunit
MGRSAEEAKEMIGNRYELVLIASQRVRELNRNYLPFITGKNGPIVTALKEIEQGFVTRDYLKKIGRRTQE